MSEGMMLVMKKQADEITSLEAKAAKWEQVALMLAEALECIERQTEQFKKSQTGAMLANCVSIEALAEYKLMEGK